MTAPLLALTGVDRQRRALDPCGTTSVAEAVMQELVGRGFLDVLELPALAAPGEPAGA
ncbi:MAG: hypothetical protein ACRDVG_05960 [Jatrophihabitantaceae bacterium]